MYASRAAPWVKNPVMAGADEDCKDVIDEFCTKTSIRFSAFVEIWNKRKFDTIYFGRRSFIDLLEFTEGLLTIAKGYCLPPNNFCTRVGGVYLLYSLYYVQPTKDDDVPYVKVRVTMEEWDSLEEFKQKCKEDGELEVFYMLWKMLREGAFHFTASRWPHCVSKLYRQYLNEKRSDVHNTVLEDFKNSQGVKALQEAYEIYGKLKEKLPEADSSASAASVNYSDTNFAEVLKSTFESFGKHNVKPS